MAAMRFTVGRSEGNCHRDEKEREREREKKKEERNWKRWARGNKGRRNEE